MIYHAYAPIYRRAGLEAFGRRLAARIALRFPPMPGAHALDLACGSGAAAFVLARAGYQTVGVDRSAAMISLAGADAGSQPAVSWLCADLTALPLPHPLLPAAHFQLITCLFDSLNYLTADDSLLHVFAAVAQLLAPGGRFIFDLNTEHEFLSWDERDVVVHDGPDLLLCHRLSYQPAARRAHGRVIWFTRDGDRWWRAEELHHVRPWSSTELNTALAAAGLQLVTCLTPSWQAPTPSAPRLVYLIEHAR